MQKIWAYPIKLIQTISDSKHAECGSSESEEDSNVFVDDLSSLYSSLYLSLYFIHIM